MHALLFFLISLSIFIFFTQLNTDKNQIKVLKKRILLLENKNSELILQNLESNKIMEIENKEKLLDENKILIIKKLETENKNLLHKIQKLNTVTNNMKKEKEELSKNEKSKGNGKTQALKIEISDVF